MKEIDKAKKEEYERKMLIESLEKMPARVIATAYLHALNYELYGVDVTDKWDTAVKNTDNLQHAYLKGRRDEAARYHGDAFPSIDQEVREALEKLPRIKRSDFALEPVAFLRQYQGKTLADSANTIDRMAAINVVERMRAYIGHNMERAVGRAVIEILDEVGKGINDLPPAPEPVITHEQAVDHLQSTGWMQEHDRQMMLDGARKLTVRAESHEIGYDECANALLKMWMDGVLTDGEYYRIANVLNAKWGKIEPFKP